MRPRGRAALCCCLVPALLLLGFFAAPHGDHECPGEGCPLCLLARESPDFSRPPRALPAPPAFPPVLFPAALPAPRISAPGAAPLSSVGLKVRINR